jgi:hypothetical protein
MMKTYNRRNFFKLLGKGAAVAAAVGLPEIDNVPHKPDGFVVVNGCSPQEFIEVRGKAKFNTVDENGDIINEHAFDSYFNSKPVSWEFYPIALSDEEIKDAFEKARTLFPPMVPLWSAKKSNANT